MADFKSLDSTLSQAVAPKKKLFPGMSKNGVFASQFLPFYDDTAIDLLGKFETSVYQNV